MLSELCAECLGKDVHSVFGDRSGWLDNIQGYSNKWPTYAYRQYLTLALPRLFGT